MIPHPFMRFLGLLYSAPLITITVIHILVATHQKRYRQWSGLDEVQ